MAQRFVAHPRLRALIPMPAAITRPDAAEYVTFFNRYIALVPADDVVTVLREQGRVLVATIAALDEARGGERYADGKWSIREVIGHLIDVERIFTYRALRIARGDATPLPGFDENSYVEHSGADSRTLADLREEFGSVRDGTVRLFDALPEGAATRLGVASGHSVSVRALAYICAGHAAHHLGLLHERYGIAAVR
jgi:hypothetical protein